MKGLRYINNVTTLKFHQDICVGCGNCQQVCPHRLFDFSEKKAILVDSDACIECGACATNCPVGAITVTPGVGCASFIIASWINKVTGREIMKGCC